MGCVHSKEISQRAESRRLPQSAEAARSESVQNSVESPTITAVDSERTLGILLNDNEDLLLKTLTCLMEDGLHECRRVCRRWRDACRKLPVELFSVHPDKLHRMIDLFPEAVSLTMRKRLDSEDTVERQVIPQLSRLKNLQHLYLFCDQLSDASSLVTCLLSMDRLQSLSLRMDRDVLQIFQALRRLTNLESLNLSVSCFEQTDLEPVTELRGLRDLTIGVQLIVNKRDELLFSSPTRLTSLCIAGGSLEGHTSFRIDLQVREFGITMDLSTCLCCSASCRMPRPYTCWMFVRGRGSNLCPQVGSLFGECSRVYQVYQFTTLLEERTPSSKASWKCTI